MYIEIKDLDFKYQNAKEHTIKGFCLSVHQGEIISILGSSGCGKSTILRLIAGLEVPSSGSIVINGKVMANHNRFEKPENRGIGMVFQDYALFPHMTVADNIKFGLRKMSRNEKLNRLNDLLELVGLSGYEKRFPYELSGGQQQRVALARALAPNPSLIMFDEPFSNLDANIQQKIRDELRDILKRTGITSIFVTHDQKDALALADRVVSMREGCVTKVGKPEEVINTNFNDVRFISN
ncbi:ABC transporter ATP-binding protein [Mesobacillus harenae]|uniref:ABC transporter ATP-binding protein n=1 Tax=Mesobacillus harenae TaxID=2213203 RepID=UPI0015800295|nr:ABC transporter ATP-binding protein [Mesobacillus harenae]